MAECVCTVRQRINAESHADKPALEKQRHAMEFLHNIRPLSNFSNGHQQESRLSEKNVISDNFNKEIAIIFLLINIFSKFCILAYFSFVKFLYIILT
ncbi:hypothetical protein BpHYR1_014883 [Brachionus plicatilis]|uniref:Uncharacterized protein n=1 Tax=Brachionus plicatilis TaxID=10195 RepID=A0A3M7T8U8_BRAPC|nr:hypothetical protein BpHYR1_014883 [Brachionus plicatilis]